MDSRQPNESVKSGSSLSTEGLPTVCSTRSDVDRMYPLRGKKIFLHYDPVFPRPTAQENVLKKLKAEFVDFFDKSIHYVLTNGRMNRPPSSDRSAKSPDDQSTGPPPPLIPTPFLKPKPSPTSFTPSSARSRAMLAMVAARKSEAGDPVSSSPSAILRQINQPDTPPRLVNTFSDLLVRARQLGIKVLSVQSVNKWIENLPNDVLYYLKSEQHHVSEDSDNVPADPERDRIHKVKPLDPPCLKIIELSGQYRPIFMDRTDYSAALWNACSRSGDRTNSSQPQINSLGASCPRPSASTKGHSALSHRPSKHHVLRRRDRVAKKQSQEVRRSSIASPAPATAKCDGDKLSQPARPASTNDNEPSGYCECCAVQFKSLFAHLTGDEHQQFANNTENFRLLDTVLNSLDGLDSFLNAQCSENSTKICPCDETIATGEQSVEVAVESAPPIVLEPAVVVDQSNIVDACPPILSSSLLSHQSITKKVILFSDDEEETNAQSQQPCNHSPSNAQTITATTTSWQAIRRQATNSLLRPIQLTDDDGCHQAVASIPASKSSPSHNHDDQSIFPLTQPLLAALTPVISINNQLPEVDTLACTDGGDQSSITATYDRISPELKAYHRRCRYCNRCHIPSSLPSSLQSKYDRLFGKGHPMDGMGCWRAAVSSDQHQEQEERGADVISSTESSTQSNVQPANCSPIFDVDEKQQAGTNGSDELAVPSIDLDTTVVNTGSISVPNRPAKRIRSCHVVDVKLQLTEHDQACSDPLLTATNKLGEHRSSSVPSRPRIKANRIATTGSPSNRRRDQENIGPNSSRRGSSGGKKYRKRTAAKVARESISLQNAYFGRTYY